MARPLDEIVRLLDLEELEVNIFRGSSPAEDRDRVFGGQVAAQSLVAAERTVSEDRRVHSLHSYFLRPGDVAAPIVYFVDRIRDGRSFSTRLVVAIQHGKPIFNMSASFQKIEPGFEHHLEMPSAPDPETLPTFSERMHRIYGDKTPAWVAKERIADIRWDEAEDWVPHVGDAARGQVWMRADGELPDDPGVHRAVLVYMSDFTLTETVMRPHGVHWMDGGVMTASLEHSVWFHGEIRPDEWWL